MTKKIKILLFLSFLIFINCNKKEYSLIKTEPLKVLKKRNPLTKKELQDWYLKDIELDTILGVSLYRAYDNLLVGKAGKEVIVAIIDKEIDAKHEDLLGKIWQNKDEINSNKIDDDKNGYVDDIYGWNFIGNLNNENIIYSSSELVRIIREFDNQFKNKDSVLFIKSDDYKFYIRAKEKHEQLLKEAKSNQEYGNFLFDGLPKAKKTLKKLFPKENYTINQLDSVYKKYKI